MSKDQWMAEVEQIGERLANDEIDRETAINEWVALGLDRDEAEGNAAATLD